MIEDKTYITPKSSMPEIVITPSGQSPEELAIELAYLDRFKNARLSIPVDNTAALQSKMNKAVAERNGLGRLFAPYFLGVFNPLAFTASMIGGHTVDEVSSAAYNATHNDKADGFGQALVRSTIGKGHPIAETVAGFFNPGYLLGGSTLKGADKSMRMFHTNLSKKAIQEEAARMMALNMKKPVIQSETMFPGLVGWAPKLTFKGYHASNEQVFKPDFFYKGWALKTHNAPYGIYAAEGTTPASGFLAERPYVHSVEIPLEKPMILIGEVKSTTKNGIRNQIEREAQSLGSDGIIYLDIADNQMQHQSIIKTLNPDTKVEVGKLFKGLTEAEKFGLPKHDRKALSLNELQALEDLALYRNSGLFRQVFRVTPDWENFGWDLDKSNPTFMQLFVKESTGVNKGSLFYINVKTPTGKGVLSYDPDQKFAQYFSKSFSKPEGLSYYPGEASMFHLGTNSGKIILTSPKTDIYEFLEELKKSNDPLYEKLNKQLSSTIDKNIMKDFWSNVRKIQRPGSYLSGDNGRLPKGSDLIEGFKKRQLYKIDLKERPLNQQFVTRDGLSPDSYSSIIRQGLRDGSLRWGEGFEKWNASAVNNKNIYEAWQKMKKGEISIPEYERIFNQWSQELGGKPLQIFEKNNTIHIVHPHPYIYAKKFGGVLTQE